MKEFLETLNDHTRATYYVLPLISLNKFSFGPPENFINAYVSSNLDKIKVVVKDSNLVYDAVWIDFPPSYHSGTEIVFDIPVEFRGDLELFKEGKYSKFSLAAKNQIIEYSALTYNKRGDDKESGLGTITTDARLLALTKAPLLREYLEDELHVSIDPDSELISKPSDSEFWKNQGALTNK